MDGSGCLRTVFQAPWQLSPGRSSWTATASIVDIFPQDFLPVDPECGKVSTERSTQRSLRWLKCEYNKAIEKLAYSYFSIAHRGALCITQRTSPLLRMILYLLMLAELREH